MKPIPNWESINEAGEFKNLPASIQPIRLTSVVDVPEKQYFEVCCDIVKGEFKDYFSNLVKQGLKDTSKTYRSYKESALTFFKGFITAFEKSNPPYKWDWDESKLVGKMAVGVFGEEEYIDDEGKVKTVVKLQEFRSFQAYQNGDVKVPECKKVTEKDWEEWRKTHSAPAPTESSEPESQTVGLAEINPDLIPF